MLERLKSKIRYKYLSLNNIDVINFSCLVNDVKNKKEIKGSSICHILGSGNSLNHSKSIINSKDYVLGCNYSPLSLIPHDFYFFEFSGPLDDNISDDHFLIASRIREKNDCLVYFKNVWDYKNNLRYIKRKCKKDNIPICKDRHANVLNINDFSTKINNGYFLSDNYLIQMISTVFSLIIIAYKSGFDEIYIHGLDFGGLYFYQDYSFEMNDIFNKNELDIFSKIPNKSAYKNANANYKHEINIGSIKFEDIILTTRDWLETKGVCLYSASENNKLGLLLKSEIR